MKRISVLIRLLSYMRSLWGVMGLSMLMRCLNYCSGIAIITSGAWGISYVAMNPMATFPKTLLWVLPALGLCKGIFRYLEHFTGHYVAFHLLASLRLKLYEAVEPLTPAGLVDVRSGDIVSRAGDDINRIEVFYAHTIAPVANAILIPCIVLIFLAVKFNVLFSIVLIPFMVGVGILAPWLSDRIGKRFSINLRKGFANVSAHLTDSIQGLREIITFSAEDRRRDEIKQHGQSLSGFQKGVASATAVQNAITDLFIGLGIVSTFMAGIRLFRAGEFDLLMLAPVLALATSVFGPIAATSSVLHDFNQAISAARRLFVLMDQVPLVTESITKAPTGGVEPSISFNQVDFSYPGTTKSAHVKDRMVVLDCLDFEVMKGQKVAIVGKSGSGKSTVVNLLLHFWDVNKGQIRLGSYDIRDLPFEYLRQMIAVVSQQMYLFNTTIKENLLIGKPDASDEEIEQTAKLANIHDFINKLPDGYETRVGEMGVAMSGGQRQRLAIARALLKNAPILILDEATSSLDVETEKAIQNEIRLLQAGRTTLVIAHRLSSVMDADQILVMDSGRIVEKGKHQELLKMNGLYAKTFIQQCALF
ncbi:MAG: thiol reductant ABC exporter subunit CydC [Anaerolineaceae bacterium]|nr:thiol reductant ABC exporter subunit CydC [Anaerolineaceae bacterium]